MAHPNFTQPDPTGLRALVTELETAIAAARAGDRAAYGTARTAAQAVETRARQLDVEVHTETFRIAEGEMRAADRARRDAR